MRKIVLDTETTGINKLGPHYVGQRIIEIGGVEIINRRLTGQCFHVYLKPDNLVDPEAFNIHGISDEFLADKPAFSDAADEFLQFIYGSELVIHNAPFDIGFIDHELSMLNQGIAKIHTFCQVTDSLLLARNLFPGKRNSLDALCARYFIDKNKRTRHGALLDAEILADVFLLMTGGQTAISFLTEEETALKLEEKVPIKRTDHDQMPFKIIHANDEEIMAHEAYLDLVKKKSSKCLWKEVDPF